MSSYVIAPLVHLIGIVAVAVALHRAERIGTEKGDWEPLNRFVGVNRWLLWLVMVNVTIMLAIRIVRQVDPLSIVLAAVVFVGMLGLIWKVNQLRKQYVEELAALPKRPPVAAD